MSRDIVFVGGSPSSTSRSRFVAGAVAHALQGAGWTARHFSLGDFDAEDVFHGRTSAPKIAAFVDAVKSAAAIVLSTPVYKATYSGALKALVDLIPPDALAGKPALGIATIRLEAHGPEVDHAYRALFAFFQAKAVGSLIVRDDELPPAEGGFALNDAARDRTTGAAKALLAALETG
ncbi:NAD(P)H-dependent oxidoreductase [Pendulispora rubella]|uniref:NAD(P)H-dependent oxidoreductase n=1 Tax=Pendulispora rubella TaxID=2741070 RepID=A0ABZ2KYT5_9BACT